jgi:Putative restriction endonuclease
LTYEEQVVTASPAPGRLLTVADYVALPEDELQRWELLERNLVMSPRPTTRHMIAVGELYSQLVSQLPEDAQAVLEIEIDLQLAPARAPATVRNPDLVIVARGELARVDREGGPRSGERRARRC